MQGASSNNDSYARRLLKQLPYSGGDRHKILLERSSPHNHRLVSKMAHIEGLIPPSLVILLTYSECLLQSVCREQ